MSEIKNKKIVVIGGGNGSALTLRALKKYHNDYEISGVISVTDSGGSSGRLRQEFKTLPPGDLLRAIIALSKYDYKMLKNIFYGARFDSCGKLDKHNLGNLFLVLAQKYDGSWLNTIRAFGEALDTVGKVYPTTLDNTNLVVELTNGKKIVGEAVIDRPTYDRKNKIAKMWLEPEAPIFIGAQKVVEEADYIFFGPGSLYTSIIAAILPSGFKTALKKSKAKLVYIVGNAYEIEGETGPEKLSDFIKELEIYLPRPLDLVIYNNHELSVEQKQKYTDKKWNLIYFDTVNVDKNKLMPVDFEKMEAGLDDEKLGEVLRKLIV